MREPTGDSGTVREEDAGHQAARKVANRAIRRLGLLEAAMVVAAVALSLLGGAVIALLLSSSAGLSFRGTWTVASLIILAIPAAVAWIQERRSGETP